MAGRDGRMPTLFSLWRASARRENSAASSLPETTRLRFALLGAQRAKYMLDAVRRMRSSADDTRYFLVNQLGQQLVASHQAPGDDSASELDFSVSHSTVWQQVTARPSGSIEFSDGLWVWERFASAAMLKVSGLSLGDLESSRIHANQLALTLIANKPSATLLELRQVNRVPVILGVLVVLSIYALSLFVLLRGLVIEQAAKLKARFAAAHAVETERVKELQERFRRLVETSSIGQVLIDDAGQVVMSNPAAETMLGYVKGELIGRPVDELVPPELQGQHVRWRRDYLAAPEARKMGKRRELEAVAKNGRRIPVEIGLNPYVEDDKQFVLASIIDLSERGEDAVAGQVPN
jgi:PAS domain S-box-containing protein